MNAPIFKIKATVAPSIKQYFSWKSGVRDTYTLTDCSVERVNGVYEFFATTTDQYGNVRDYFQNQTNANLYIAIHGSSYGEISIYICEYTGDITTVNAWNYGLVSYYTGIGIFNEIYYSEPLIEMATMPTVATSNKGTGDFSFKLGNEDWSIDTGTSEFTLEDLADGSSHTFHVREKLVDESYSDTAECAFTVTFISGTIQPQAEFELFTTDLTSHTVNFTLLSYESKLLSGLTVDTLNLGGMYIPSGIRNSGLYYRNGDFYLWYSSRFSRWMITSAAQFDNESGIYDYYECYLYANNQTTAATWPSGVWYGGYMADMSISGTPAWNGGIYHVIPIGTGICRYQVNGGFYVQMDAGVTSFTLAMALGNSYEIKISELLDNALWSPENTIIIDCARLSAPQLTTADDLTESDGGHNVTLQWSGAGISEQEHILGGSGIFRYRINNGIWSAETQAVSALQMFQLPTGEHTISLQEKSGNGVWSEAETLTLTVTDGAEAGSGSGDITVPEGAYLVLVDVAGKEYLWNGVAPLDDTIAPLLA